jgi:hypothetical protein
MTKAKKVKTKVRLEKHIKPNKYTLTLKPDLESFTFEGKEIIDIVLDKSVKEITTVLRPDIKK